MWRHMAAVLALLQPIPVFGQEIWPSDRIDAVIEKIREDRSRIQIAEVDLDLTIEEMTHEAKIVTASNHVTIWWQADGKRVRVDREGFRPNGESVIETRMREITELRSSPIGYLRFQADQTSAANPTFQMAVRDISTKDPSRNSGFVIPDIRFLGSVAADVEALGYRTFEGTTAERLIASQTATEARVERELLGDIQCWKMTTSSLVNVRGQKQRTQRTVWFSNDAADNLIRKIQVDGEIDYPNGESSRPHHELGVDYVRHGKTGILFPSRYTFERSNNGDFLSRETAVIRLVRLNEEFPSDPFSLRAVKHLPAGAVGYGGSESLKWDGSQLRTMTP